MNYEKLYKEALERAKEYLTPNTPECVDTLSVITTIFPELKESEDEKVRKGIIELVKQSSEILNKKNQERMLVWLEKQSDETKIEALRTEYEKGRADALAECRFDYSNANIQQKDYASIDPQFYKQEQKAESKFKVGDWIVNKGHSYLIADIDYLDNRYLFEIGGYTNEQLNWEYIENADKTYHLWTIQDAKDGDVLVHNDCTFIFMGIKDGIVQAIEENTLEPVPFGEPNKVNDYHPATKEQRDLLFQKMNKAGYEWDAEKKELKKISQRMISAEAKEAMYDKPTDLGEFINELSKQFPDVSFAKLSRIAVRVKKWVEQKQKPAWSEDDEAYKLFTISAVEDYYDEKNPLQKELVNWIKSLKNRVQPQTKEWKEEDNKWFESLIQTIEDGYLEGFNQLKSYGVISWLKSIKERVQPQPKQEWSKEDEERLKSCLNILQAKGFMGVTDTINTKWLKSLKERL